MPGTIRKLDSEQLAQRVRELGRQIRQRRRALGVTATGAAEAAGMSRVTWHRIEKGEITVTIGAWFNALAVLGMEFGVGPTPMHEAQEPVPGADAEQPPAVPVEIPLRDYPQLRALAWQVTNTAVLTPKEALDIYQRNRRFLDWDAMGPAERRLIHALTRVFGEPDLD